MTVSTIIPVNNYKGNNSVTDFDFDFLIQSQDELEVFLTDANGIINTLSFGIDYSINEIGNENGSYITFPLSTSAFEVLKPDETITLSLSLPIKQESEFENSANLDLDILEYTFDYIVRVLQILNRKIDRCVKTNEGIDISPDSLLEQINTNAKVAVSSAASAVSSRDVVTQKESYIENLLSEKEKELNSKLNNFEELSEKTINDILSLGIETRSKVDLSNLSSEGEKHFINKTQISDCVLEIPQRLRYELLDGILTVKSGSVIIVPYGTEDLTETYPIGSIFLNDNFKVVDSQYNDEQFFVWLELQNDISAGTNGYSLSGFTCIDVASNCICTDTATTTTDISENAFYYNSAENLLQFVGTEGDLSKILSLPLFISTLDATTGFTSIDQVFNACGYFCTIFWVDKGFKVLLPNGRNDDGTLNNLEVITSNLQILNANLDNTQMINISIDSTGNISQHTNEWTFFEQDEEPTTTTDYNMWYSPKDNIYRQITDEITVWTTLQITFPIIYSGDKTQITSFYNMDTFRAVNYSNRRQIIAMIAPDIKSKITVFSLPYTAPTYGWWVHYGININGTVAINGVGVDTYSYAANNWPGHQSVQILLSPGDVVSVTYGSAPQSKMFIPCKGV